jgi:hypothetical protein
LTADVPQVAIDRAIDRNSTKNASEEGSHYQQCARSKAKREPLTTCPLFRCRTGMRVPWLSIISEDL